MVLVSVWRFFTIVTTAYNHNGFGVYLIQIVAASCVWLASKLEENPKKARQVIIVFHRMECRRENLPLDHLDLFSKVSMHTAPLHDRFHICHFECFFFMYICVVCRQIVEALPFLLYVLLISFSFPFVYHFCISSYSHLLIFCRSILSWKLN